MPDLPIYPLFHSQNAISVTNIYQFMKIVSESFWSFNKRFEPQLSEISGMVSKEPKVVRRLRQNGVSALFRLTPAAVSHDRPSLFMIRTVRRPCSVKIQQRGSPIPQSCRHHPLLISKGYRRSDPQAKSCITFRIKKITNRPNEISKHGLL